jgi:recombinational DNA repair protein (RecF pathway)
VLTQGEVMGSTRPTSDLATLTEWDLQQPYLGLRRTLPSLHASLYIVDLANALLPDHDPHPAAFDAVVDHLSVLTEHGVFGDVKDSAKLIAASMLACQWRLIVEAGYRPELAVDVHTGEALPDQATLTFDPHTGGLTAQTGIGESDDPTAPGPWRVRRQTIELLRRCANADGSLRHAEIAAIDRANRLLCVYARALLDRELHTMTLLLNPESP